MPTEEINLLFVHRIKNKPVKYWNLRFRYRGRVIHYQAFRDDFYGGKERALAAAVKKRDKIAHCLGIDVDRRRNNYRYLHHNISCRNKTGVIGVSCWEWGPWRYYKAHISLERNREKVKQFNAELLGEEEAFALACEQRKQWEEELLAQNRG